ncbi:glycine hydroxymethyltransferase [Ktedonosporobacter rubrisoli]|uniref:Serine hydroxymethyltransferase n=1 Tax=Ktedonosporobacter rubrisoli TaxID=2509675 RepID=A0A4P6K3B1_KTERU|nr:glycine hydroxymethyltransferase [Ktedonosporobacter rubrisoli]QBD82240.1 glycine hydroxymethyltransferase [Ktedonosporobacter rubrisoli]
MYTTTTAPTLLSRYLQSLKETAPQPAAAAFYASLDVINSTSPSVSAAIVKELEDQRSNLKLIASENYSSLATQLASGNLFTDKYAEGYPYHRFYAGCDNVDAIEAEAAELACKLFGAEHAYVQPHSGADANLVAFFAILTAKVQSPLLAEMNLSDPSKVSREDWAKVRFAAHNQRLLALDYYSGGHLTHGYRHNISSHLFDVHSYGVDAETRLIDLDKLREQLHEIRPLILLAGYSAYPRKLNFARMRELADEVGAVLMVDMAHFAGLVAGKVFTGEFDPVPYAHIITTTTHKTLRGPRGGLVLCKQEFAEWVDKGCPFTLGGPLPHIMAAKAVALREAATPEFSRYTHRIVENAQALAQACVDQGLQVATGGTDNHLFLLDVAQSFGLTGRQAESALRECAITLNRNSLPFDINGPWYTSGLRLGTPAITTLGMGTEEMKEIASIVKLVLAEVSPAKTNSGKKSLTKYNLDQQIVDQARQRVKALLQQYPLYPELDTELLAAFLSQSAR